MRMMTIAGFALALLALNAAAAPAAASGDTNPHGYGIYSPEDAKGRTFRYDPRSWYYRVPGYYPGQASRYWVPRANMRYRYRYQYYTPRYYYEPTWGYPRPGH